MSEKDKAILEEANAAIADIALQVSFSSQSHLKQHFSASLE